MDIYMGDTLVSDIYMGGPDYSAIQGPCDSGFHIPSTSEWEAVISTVGTVGADYFTYLHIPKCGYRDRKTTNIITTYGFSRYWCNTMTAKDKADCWGIEQTDLVQMYLDDKPANGYPIRAFKDAPVAPDSSWTETISNKVWYNATLGLISIKNGSEWITMQDKNVGATVVYNNGDTVNNSNAGSFFQFGNYYGFPYSGTLSTYTSLQDTTGYGWQNPYSNNHFVKINSNNWFSNTNNDIWGGVTGVVAPSEVQEIYEGATKVWPSTQPFTPGANTLVYFPFDGDANDHSGNGYTLSATGTQETIGRRFNTAVNLVGTISQLANFQSYWMKLYTCGSGGSNAEAQVDVYPTTGYMCYQSYVNYGSPAYDRVRFVYNSYWNQHDYTVGAEDNLNNWYHIVLAYSNPGGAWIFINGVKHQLTAGTSSLDPATTVNSFISNGSTIKMDVALSDVIAETVARSDADVLAYFNATKSKYGVS